ncbi:MAG TPA: hypothetical protein DEQ87_17440 [Algoriphagus sp.]|jgi:ABC-type oligopeptide transport system substrate-binding subunit|uniref:hypothetical protein n=1 Tax=unclassified Algoriphagus TaxID=2641541 RepID=UPI000C618777|nr:MULTISPECIES: hypothetical protein [unclassified Algoriphagus]MAL14105.1 hypothetical protein [Algoriphagus sp.]MAN87730.1 hypothetical protein [Algoriphagus sp.]QYH37910.1 hypothetical protein GYM62_03530 [Algoriphagus sp. NBT04N3]HAD51651.1 hypothetical protein [Algoriphagus sp.]HAH36226.1 hypothetical protein [Algoriphagus sp.]|tara:strand:+ start:1001 stop:1222 length:222 start_codon:yes stop_codon:yes gene_type:complete
MKKLKSIFTLALAFSFLAAVTFTSCGGKKEERSETETEQVESEHPDGGEHPAGDSTEHPAGGEHPSSDSTSES